MQSFVLVAEIGADVPERLTCFQREEDETECNGNIDPFARFGATMISIIDNDGRFAMHILLWYARPCLCYGIHCSYDNWILSAETDCIRG